MYRSEGEGAWRALAALPASAAFDDSDVAPGTLYHYRVAAVSSDGQESAPSDPVTAVPSGIVSDDRDAVAYLWSNNPHQQLAATWCWDENNVPSYCGIADEPDTIYDTSVRALTVDGQTAHVCEGDCTSPSTAPPELFAPAVSPDGSKVAYVEIDDNDHALLRLANLNGSNKRSLCDDPTGPEPCLDAWPDTSPIARHCPSADECFSIRGTTAGALTPSFSADGTYVLYGGNGLYKVAVDGGAPVKLTAAPPDGTITNPRQSSDGAVIYFDILTPPTATSNGPASWRINSDGSGLHRVHLPVVASVPDPLRTPYPWDNPRYNQGGYAVAPSPDGRRIAYVSSNELFVADADRSNAYTLGVHPNAAVASWTADSRHLVFQDWDGIKQVDVVTDQTTSLVTSQDGDYPVAVGGQQHAAAPTVSTPDLVGDARYSTGDATVSIRVRGSSPLGVRSVAVAVDGQHPSQQAQCDPSCPTSFASSLTIDAAHLTEGRHVVHIIAVNAEGTEAAVERTLVVDRTEPSAPTDVDAVDHDGQTTVTWRLGEDATLPDATDGGALINDVRTQTPDGDWTAWAPLAERSVTVPSGVVVEVRSRDRAGNVSQAASTAHPSSPNPTCVIPQPSPIGGFHIQFASCEDLDDHGGVIDLPSPEHEVTKIPLVGRDKRKTECDDHEVGEATSKAEREVIREECGSYTCDAEMRQRIRVKYRAQAEGRPGVDPKQAGLDAEKRLCDDETWYDVYRLFKPGPGGGRGDTVLYVGISNDYDRRCSEHYGPRGKYRPANGAKAKPEPKPDATPVVSECLVTVPNLALAKGVEQALIELYGMNVRRRNRNFDHAISDTNPPGADKFGRFPTLENVINSIWPGRYQKKPTDVMQAIRTMYCSVTVGGRWLLTAEAPQVDFGNALGAWDPNFPRRDCNRFFARRQGSDDDAISAGADQ